MTYKHFKVIRPYFSTLLLSFFAIAIFFASTEKTKSGEIKQESSRQAPEMRPDWDLPTPILPRVLDPQTVLTETEKCLSLLSFSRLVQIDGHLQIEADLVKKWELDFERNAFTFHIRPGVIFQNGVHLTAKDIAFSITEWARPESLDHDLLLPILGVGAFQTGKSEKIKGITIKDDATLEVRLEYWNESLIRTLANPRFVIYPNNYAGMSHKDFFQHPIGTGPFQLVKKDDENAWFKANDDYYLGRPKIASIHAQLMSEEKAIHDFKDKKIDNLLLYPLWQIKDFASDDVDAITLSRRNALLLFISPIYPPFKNIKIRKSVADLISKTELKETCYPDSNIINSIIPSGLIGSSLGESREVGPKDLSEKGSEKETLNFGGISGLVFQIQEQSHYQCLADEIERKFKNTGISVRRNSLDKMFKLLLSKKLQAWAETWEFKNEDPISNLQYFSSTSNEYLLGIKIPELQKLYGLLHGEISDAEKSRIYRKIDQFLTENYYVVPLLSPQGFLLHRRYLHNVDFLKSSLFFSKWHEIYVQ